MYIRRNLEWKLILRFAWPYLLAAALWSFMVFGAFRWLGWTWLDIPFEPLSLLGIAVAFFLGFKNSQSYDRFWDARKIWGGILAQSRNWGLRILTLVTDEAAHGMSSALLRAERRKLIYRHFAWVHALRLQLRRPAPFSIQESSTSTRVFQHHISEETIDTAIAPFLSEAEFGAVTTRFNVATQLLRLQAEHLRRLKEDYAALDGFDQDMCLHVLEAFACLQTQCEGIKSTPFPRQYSYFARVFTYIFVLLLPFGLLDIFGDEIVGQGDQEPGWYTALMIPMSVLISGIYLMWDLIGSNSEDPFEHRFNDVPMTALCREIEIDLRDMLDESPLPEEVAPRENILY